MKKDLDPLTAKPMILLARYATTSIFGLLASSTAILVDGVFIGHWVGPQALAATNFIIPLLSIIYSIGFMICVGGSISVGKHLGENNPIAASKIFSHTLVTLSAISIGIITFVYWNINKLFLSIGATQDLLPLIREYLHVLLPFTLFQMMGVALYFFMKMDKQPMLAAGALVIGAIINIILDIYFIVVLHWGVEGAAWATGISQLIQFMILLRYFVLPERKLKFIWDPNYWVTFLKSNVNGLPTLVNTLSGSLVSILLNWVLIKHNGPAGVAAFASMSYLFMINVLISSGVSDAILTLVSQNYGAKQHCRIKILLRSAMGAVSILSIISVTLLFMLHKPFLQLFLNGESQNVSLLAERFITIMWPMFLISGINILFSSYFVAIQFPIKSGVIAISRSLIFPATFLLILTWWLPSISFLWAFPIAELLTLVLAATLFYTHSSVSKERNNDIRELMTEM